MQPLQTPVLFRELIDFIDLLIGLVGFNASGEIDLLLQMSIDTKTPVCEQAPRQLDLLHRLELLSYTGIK